MCNTNAVVLDGNVLSDGFVKLRTGLAGAVLQKFGNYNVKAAVVIKGGQDFPARYQEMVYELRTGNTFRIFTKLEEAIGWILA
jgi:PadR family transcriptional regulator AphA